MKEKKYMLKKASLDFVRIVSKLFKNTMSIRIIALFRKIFFLKTSSIDSFELI